MNTLPSVQAKENALEIIKGYRVPDLQALLEFARLSRQGNKRDLFQRCKILISSSLTPQLLNKINQINIARLNSVRSHHTIINISQQSSSRDYHNQNAIALSSKPTFEHLPLPNLVQYAHLPFFERLRTIDSINVPVDWNTHSPFRFILNDFDIDFIQKGVAKVFLRIVPTIVPEKQDDVLPPYFFAQCNNQIVLNNNTAKVAGSQAHSISFPSDITDKLIFKPNIPNTITYRWIQLPTHMPFKNLPKSYTLSVQIVRCIPLNYLFDSVLQREPASKNAEANDSDIEIEDLGLMTTRHRVSLLCPITQALIVMPVKSSYCTHLACFDLRAFLLMNERRLRWICPLCKKPATYENLCVDQRLKTILSNVPPNCSTVEIDSSTKVSSDCQYIIDNVKQEKSATDNANASHEDDNTDHDDNKHNECDNESDGEDNYNELRHGSSNKSRRESSSSDCIVLSSASESRDENELEDAQNQSDNCSLPITPCSNDLFNQTNTSDEQQTNSTNQSFDYSHSFPSLLASNSNDESYWNDLASLAYNFIANSSSEQNASRKRSNSSILSSSPNDDDHRRRKRSKPSPSNKPQSTDIEVIVLSSSDSSDDDDH